MQLRSPPAWITHTHTHTHTLHILSGKARYHWSAAKLPSWAHPSALWGQTSLASYIIQHWNLIRARSTPTGVLSYSECLHVCVCVCACMLMSVFLPCVLSTGVPSQEELLLAVRHRVGAAEQPHPPAEEDVAGHRQVCGRATLSLKEEVKGPVWRI